ncbi:MAG: hypothetical protein N3D12_05930 [Candidatus Methanomethyliaceae archaeon]|nr:hypothetical protein [Candidatus Methanomethyliaceae archaeon]
MTRNKFHLVRVAMIVFFIANQVHISASGYITYFSGDDVVLSLGEGPSGQVATLYNLSYASFCEDFIKPPYSTANQWANYNEWKFSGSCPSWPGSLWCGVTDVGYLQWHNWLHGVGGAVYDFKMWKDIGTIGPYFELYVPISTARPSGGGVAGSPELHISIALYDGKGAKIFFTDVVYNNPIRRIGAWIYGVNKTVENLYLNSLNIKLWQNSSGAYFSYDNGSSVIISGLFYTSPTRIEIGFYIWEYNPVQPFSDYEYWVNIDKVVLRTVNYEDITFSGLPAGNWSLIDPAGRQLFRADSPLHGASFSFQNRPPISDEFDDGVVGFWESVNLESIYESGGRLVTAAKPNTWGSWSGARYKIASPVGDFRIEASLSYVGQSSDLAEIYLAVLDTAGSIVAYAGVCDAWAGSNPQWSCSVNQGSSWTSGANTLPGTGSIVINIQRTGSSWTIKSEGAYVGIWTTIGSTAPIQYILLTNTRYYSYNGKNAQWDYIKTNIPGTSKPFDGALVGLVDSVYVKRGTFYPNSTLIYCERGGYFTATQTEQQTCFTIKGVPINDVVRVYEGNVLKKTVVSTGGDVLIQKSEVAQPFTGTVEVVSRPYLRSVATYTGSLDWNEMLVYGPEGTLTKQTAGISAQVATVGSECTTTAGWTFSYNLVSGGQTPTFSSSSGYVRFDEPQLSYYTPGYPFSEIPVMEAWYYLRYDVNAIVRNLTVSTLADGSFTYYATADKLLEGWGEIILYIVRGGNWTAVAQSTRSTAPSLNVTLANLYPNSFAPVDTVVVAFHTYARAREGYALYSNPQWGRVDYLRLEFYKIPDWCSVVNITGLKPGWRVRFLGAEYWADLEGRVGIPINASSWPTSSTISVYPPTFSIVNTFYPGNLYYIFLNRSYSPRVDTLYYEVKTEIFSYKVEFTLTSIDKRPFRSGMLYEIVFKYAVYEDGNRTESRPKAILIEDTPATIYGSPGALKVKFSHLNYTDCVDLLCIDASGIHLAGKIRLP